MKAVAKSYTALEKLDIGVPPHSQVLSIKAL
jgi:hypothetical protein